VHLRALPVVAEEVVVHAVEVALLLARGAVVVLVAVLADLAFGVVAIREELGDDDAGGRGLGFCAGGARLLLLARLSLLLFGCCGMLVYVYSWENIARY
jgi:hypothetical protein